MKPLRAIFVAACCLSGLIASAPAAENFDAGWLFLKADAPGAEQAAFADSAWRKLDLPHDWSIEGPFAETNKTGGAGAFLPSGIGWYRKHFSLDQSDAGKSVSLTFDGVMQNSDVWINGFHLGHRPFGYVSFNYELTGHLNFGGDNVIAVRCDTSAQPASRWYSGAGIYRHVHLAVTSPVRFTPNGIFISTPQISPGQATVLIESTVTNETSSACDILVQTVLISPAGKPAAVIESTKTVAAGAAETVRQQTAVQRPALWNLDTPLLYHAVSKILAQQAVQDESATAFGIRDARFTSDQGFVLNGKKVVLYGVCLHHDGGAFGAAVPLAIWEQRLNALRSFGVNSIRTAHNPPAPEFLDLCDRMGFLVMDEMFDCWTVGKNTYDYHLYFDEWSQLDEHDAILRDRNHPSVVLYSVGNEIHDTPLAEKAKHILSGLVQAAHAADPTRPVTQALFRPNVSHDYDDGLADLLDVVGTNYRDNELLAAQRAKPERKIIGTEQRHDRQTWLWLRDNPSHSGQFLWTGVDYLGESQRWPLVNHSSGLLDRTGNVKPMAFERQSWWSTVPVVRLARRTAPNDRMPEDPGYGGPELHTQVQFADWTSRNPAPHDETVEAYSNCSEVELFLNGKSLGAQKIHEDASPRVWKVLFAPGTLKAVAKNDGKVVAQDELRTAGKGKKVILSTETKKLAPGWDDVAIVRATIVDANGITVPRAADLISFKLSGPGVIAAVDNVDPVSHEPFQAAERHAFQGGCVAFVKATASSGKITLTATADGLTTGSITFKASPELSR
ncbi:MAG TPA: glycoside hydrolase family 2 TIM barrel-domain containing protein [Candidatus Acidoferrales bacterium]|jgi:beta-galactosidase|nr:glycoside hydrolase family 2 TIM barrel-domain containing protein [Candidatus Acidoferrales bacterium]